MAQAKYLWLDIETTGLDPETDFLLECAWIVTDADLVEVERGEMVLRVYDAPRFCDDFVREMHTKNGLLAEVARIVADGFPADLGAALKAVIGRHEWSDEKPILAGSTPHFDRGFLDYDLGDLGLHHRHFDVSTLKMAFRDALGEEPAGTESIHRAMPDIEDSLAVARSYRNRIRGLGA